MHIAFSERMDDMNALTIVLIVLIAAAVGAVLLTIFRRKNRKPWAAIAIALVPATLVAALAVGLTFSEVAVAQEGEAAVSAAETRTKMLDMSFALLSQSETVGAEKLLNEYTAEYPLNHRCLLARARLEALRRNYSQAEGIYRLLMNQHSSDQERFQAEYNELTLLQKGSGTYQKMAELILRDIGSMGLSENAIGAARTYALVDTMSLQSTDASKAKTAVEAYRKYSAADPGLFASSVMERSYLKAMVIAGDYAGIVDRSARYSDVRSLLVLAELCRSNKISNTVLRNSSINQKIHDRNERIASWIDQQERSNDFSDSEETIADARAVLEQSDISTPKLYRKWIRSQLLALARNEHEKEASKLYLMLARLDYGDQNSNSSEYVRRALLTAANSDDEVYAGAAAEINQILTNRNNTEALKSIDRYVTVMVENMSAEEMREGYGSDLSAEDQSFAKSISEELNGGQNHPGEQSDYFGMAAWEEPEIAACDYRGDSEGDTDSDSSDVRVFERYVTSQVNQMTASVNVISVDASAFEKVSLVVAVDESIADTVEKFRSKLEIYDCGIQIKDYQIEKIQDVSFNIVLVCDNSGSMGSDNKINSLKSALREFVNNLSGDVKVGIVAFDSSILQSSCAPIGSDASALRAAIDNMDDRGGTDIYEAVEYAINQVQAGEAMNIMIVMSDGQDSYPGDSNMQRLKEACMSKDVTIYSMGLGSDVDSDLLKSYSDYGGGSYTYVSDAKTLLSFYQYLLGMSRNRYRITYHAQDTLMVDRSALAVYRDDDKISDTEYYSLEAKTNPENPENPRQPRQEQEPLIALQDLTVSGLNTRLLYRSEAPQTLYLLGQGLTKDKDMEVSIKSGMTYDLSCEYVDDTRWKVTVPANAACGNYSVVVKVGGRRCVFDNGLVISSDQNQIVAFGDYVFEASNVSRTNSSVVLSGFVRMNNWLCFSGDVTLQGNPDSDNSIELSAKGAYVSYEEGGENLNSFAAMMAKRGLVFRIGSIDNMTLYRNSGIAPSSDSFTVRPVTVNTNLLIPQMFELNTPGLTLYPDRMVMNFNEFTTAFPLQDKLLDASHVKDAFRFQANHEESLIISGTAVDCTLEISASSTDQEEFKPMKFGNLALNVNLNDFTLKIDTQNADYSIKVAVNVAMLADGLGLELGWKGGQFDTARIFCDKDINTTISAVPVTFSDFQLGVTDLGEKGLSGMTLEGGCKISVAKVSALMPKLEDFVGDVSFLSLEDVKLSLSFGQQYIGLSAKAKLLETVEIGSADIRLGMQLPYSNPLLGYDDETVAGFVGAFTAGLKYDGNNLKLDMTNGGELALTNQVLGLTVEGKLKYEIRWWFFTKADQSVASMFLGYYQKHDQTNVFAVMIQTDGGKPIQFEWNPKAVRA